MWMSSKDGHIHFIDFGNIAQCRGGQFTRRFKWD